MNTSACNVACSARHQGSPHGNDVAVLAHRMSDVRESLAMEQSTPVTCFAGPDRVRLEVKLPECQQRAR